MMSYTSNEYINRQLCVDAAYYAAFEQKKTILRQLSHSQNRSVIVYDMLADEFGDMSYNQCSHMPYTMAHSLVASRWNAIHPDDRTFVKQTQQKAYEYSKSIPHNERQEYKLIFECRIKNELGEYVRLLHQYMIAELDRTGEPWLILIILTPIIGRKTGEPPKTPMMMNIRTGEYHLFKKHILFSKREVEILKYISLGHDSATIAGQLFLSKNTVDNHRKHILHKTNTENTTQALFYAYSIGLL